MVSCPVTELPSLAIIPLLIRPPQMSPLASPNRWSPIAILMVELSQLAMVISQSDRPPHSKTHHALGAGAAVDSKLG